MYYGNTTWHDGLMLVAELCSNHNGDLDRALALVQAAAQSGCTHVKFQLLRRSELWEPVTLKQLEQQEIPLPLEVPEQWLPHISDACAHHGLGLVITPCYLNAVRAAIATADVWKIASGDLTYDGLLRTVGRTTQLLILSTGASHLYEVQRAIRLTGRPPDEILLLHCISSYPTQPHDVNLSAIETLRESTGCAVGYSDHSADWRICAMAVIGYNAAAIEFHFDLSDRQGQETKHSLCPRQVHTLVGWLALWDLVQGDGRKIPQASERAERKAARRGSWIVSGVPRALRPNTP